MGNYRMVGRHAPRTWRASRGLQGKHVGIELEVQHRNGRNRILQLLPNPPRGTDAPSTEPDGSLDDNGVEIVFPPFTYKRAIHPNGFLAKSLKALATERNQLYFNNCGMHVNINTAHWERDHIRAFCAIIDNVPESWIVNVGGRPITTYSTRYRFRNLNMYNDNGIRGATAIRANYTRVECRFPGATVDHGRIKVLLDFLEVVEFIARNHFAEVENIMLNNGPANRTVPFKDLFLTCLTKIDRKKAKRVKEVIINGYREAQAA